MAVVSRAPRMEISQLSCPLCEFNTTNQWQLEEHMFTHCRKGFLCKKCGHLAVDKSALIMHFRTHSREHKMSQSEEKPIHKSKLDIHMRILTGEKPYACPECAYRAAHKSNMYTHMRIHTAKKIAVTSSEPTTEKANGQRTCPLCEFNTTDQQQLEAHMSTHVQKLSSFLQCGECGFQTDYRCIMEVHMRTHTVEKMAVASRSPSTEISQHPPPPPSPHISCAETGPHCFSISQHTCPLCEFNTTDQQQFETHMFTHVQKLSSPVQCRECGFQTDYRCIMEVHMRTHTVEKMAVASRAPSAEISKHPPPPPSPHISCAETGPHCFSISQHTCPLCEFNTTDQQQFEAHMSTHVQKLSSLVQCGECGFQTDYRCIMEVHMRTHTVEKMAVASRAPRTEVSQRTCPLCKFNTTDQQQLESHMFTHCRKGFQCEECGHLAASRSALAIHVRRHNKGKPYVCSKCQFRTAQKSMLKEHKNQMSHTDEKPFMCGECGHRARSKSNMDIHMRKHTGERPYACGECNYKAAAKGALKVHEKIHTCKPNSGGRLVKFTKCSYRAANRGRIVRHSKTHI